MEPLLTRRDVAGALGVSVGTLTRWQEAGAGPPFAKIGRRVMYRRSDVERYIDEQVRPPAQSTAS